MRTEDMILVSVDDHVIEPRGMFEGLLPAKYQDKAPQLIRRPDGTDYWYYDGNEIPNVGLNAVVGRPPEEYGIEPMSLDDMRVGCYDVHERVRDMSVNGVLGSMCSPLPPVLRPALRPPRRQGRGARHDPADNDWHIDACVGAEPGRFIPLLHPGHLGPRSRRGRGAPGRQEGLPRRHLLGEPREARLALVALEPLGPFWTACADEGTVICMHLGSSSQILVTSADVPIDVMISLQPMNMVQAAADLLWSPVLRKYTDLHFGFCRRHRLDPLRPRAHRLRVPAPPQVDGAGLRRLCSPRARSSRTASSPGLH